MIYADAGIIMRLIEGREEVRLPIQGRFQAIPEAERIVLTSRLSRLECRCKPLREKNSDLLALYDAFFAAREVMLKEIDAPVVERATEVRAAMGLKTPEAIHAATASLWGAAEFWTTDEGFTRCPDLAVVVFPA